MSLLRTPDDRVLDVVVSGSAEVAAAGDLVPARLRVVHTLTGAPGRRGRLVRRRPARARQRRTDLEADAAGLRDVDAAGIVAGMATLLPPVDRAVLTSEYGEDLSAQLRESVRTGVDGWLDDDVALTSGWGLGLDEVTVPCPSGRAART